jgi:protein-S-isoprenylcysteine O-methyltransferase Ste14
MQVVLLWIAYALITFGLRTLVQLRATGRSGWVLLRRVSHPVERVAAGMFTASLVVGFAGALFAALEPDRPWIRPWALGQTVRVTGFSLYVLGTILTFAAQLAMGRSWRIGVDATERTDLVAHGLFRLVRNPIYTAMLVTVAGLTVLSCSLLTCTAFATLLIALELQVRAVEEPYLARTHGPAYARYASRVGRFVPLLGRSRSTVASA